jgi:Txe/YoeB family toxin of Txe-Axe toxin-antitoxin module
MNNKRKMKKKIGKLISEEEGNPSKGYTKRYIQK